MFQPLFGSADNSIVVAVNNCHSQFMDHAILIVTDFWFFVAVVCGLFAFSFYYDRYPKALLFCVLLIVAIGCTDYLCASIIRPAIRQLRPSDLANPVHTLLHIVHGYTGGQYGFPSCHAANSFAIAVFASLWFRRRWLTVTLVVWALAECYTRLYLGVHYPSDIFCGIVIGSAVAYFIYIFYHRLILQLT